MKQIAYKDVKRSCFEELSKKVNSETPYFSTVTVLYNGNNLRGDLTINVAHAEDKIYNEIVILAAKIISEE